MIESIEKAHHTEMIDEVELPEDITLNTADLKELPREAQIATAFNLLIKGAFTDTNVNVRLNIEDYTQGDVLMGAVLALTHFYQTISEEEECDVVDFLSVINEVSTRYLIAKALESQEHVEVGLS